MSESMRRKNPKRAALLDEARELGIVGRHRLSADQLRIAVASRRTKDRDVKRDAALTGMSANGQGIAAIRKVRESAIVDDFLLGTVITWESDAGYNVFLYACIKTPVGWATTSKAGNMYVDQVLSFEDLLEILGRAETQNVMLASAFTPLA
jgi:hypothetical protein